MITNTAARLTQAGISYKTQVPMCQYTTFKTGGPVDLLIEPASIAQIKQAISHLKEDGIPFLVLGGCANVLISDEGIDGAIVLLNKAFADISVQGNLLTAEAGARLSALVSEAHKHGLTGLEFAAGIPGTVGGGVYMNAGAYDGELSEFIHAVTSLDAEGNLHQYNRKELPFAYRKSPFMENDHIILSCTFALQPGDVEAAKAYAKELNARRRLKQPLELPSAGSTFKRPTGNYAGVLIEQCKLKGFRIGGAMVSKKHAGFIVNFDHATTADILAVIAHVEATVKEQTGVTLEREVRVIGRNV